MLARADALAAVQEEPFDAVVIGGGITGAGVALDAASRGYSVALVERNDYAAGTSSRSSKMVHGGLRYLQQFDLGLVREALLERQIMVRLAPHLVYPTPFLVPALGEHKLDRRLGAGLNMYDVMASTRFAKSRKERAAERADEDYWAPDRHRRAEPDEVIELLPALANREPNGAYLFYDCQTDDVRLVLTILGEAERFGAVMVNGAEVVDLLEEDGGAVGVVCVDAESGDRFEVRAANVINATGVWADRIKPDEIHEAEEIPTIRPSRGTHVTVERVRLPLNAACIVPAGSGRSIFALPWHGQTLIGTTDNDYEGDIEHVQPGEEDIEYLLKAVSKFFDLELGPADLSGAYGGVRPLISTADPKKSVDISRKAELYETGSGMLTITGGKLTTWRRMAKLVVDRMVEREGNVAPCRTEEIPLGMPAPPESLDAPPGVGEESLAHLASRYGHAAREVLDVARESKVLRAPIVAGRPDILAEAAIAARREQARSVADVLLRRTRLGILAAPRLRTAKSVKPVAEAMGRELGWKPARVKKEAQAWIETARAEGVDPAAG